MTQVLHKRNEFKIPGCSHSFIDRIIKLFWRDLDDVVLVQIIKQNNSYLPCSIHVGDSYSSLAVFRLCLL